MSTILNPMMHITAVLPKFSFSFPTPCPVDNQVSRLLCRVVGNIIDVFGSFPHDTGR